MKFALLGIVMLFPFIPLACYAQDQPVSSAVQPGNPVQSINSPASSSTTDKVINFPSKFFSKIEGKTASLGQQLTRQTENYLQKMAKREAKLKKKLYKVDSAAAKRLFANSAQQYAALQQKIATDTGGHKAIPLTGEYRPYTDSLQGSLSFLQQNPQLLGGAGSTSAALNPSAVTGTAGSPISSPGSSSAGASGLSAAGSSLSSLGSSASSLASPSPQVQALESSITQLQQLQAKMQDADQAKAFIQQRQQVIGDYISQHANLQTLLGPEYQGIKQDMYYYSQQVRQYKEMLGNPDEMEQKALSLLDQLPAFQNFMKNNSQLAGLFNLPGNYGSPAALAGLQTKDQVSQIIQGQLASGGPGAAASLQSSLGSAEQGLDQYKDKLSQLGSGSGDITMPDFSPNQQKTKTFWKRLEYGTNMQTTRTNYYWPTLTDIGLSVGYKISNTSTVGVGASYEIGWGTGINHVALSSQGAGLRSFIDVKVKGTWSLTGGMEYNYTTPINSLQQIRSLGDWTQSGLIGVSKTMAIKNRFFKQTKLQLLWDFLSYQQVPQTQPIIFRVGYGLN